MALLALAIYTLRECLKAAGADNSPEVVLGLLSLVFWALMIEVTAKCVLPVMRAPLVLPPAASQLGMDLRVDK